MTEQIAITFGNDKILNEIHENHPERELFVYKALNHSGRLMMLDHSGERPVFHSPILYDVLGHSGTDHWGGFLNFYTIELNYDQQKVFDARLNRMMKNGLPSGMHSIYSLNEHKNINRRVLLATWDNYESFELWKNDENEFVPKEYHDSPNFYSHEAYYTPVPKKELS